MNTEVINLTQVRVNEQNPRTITRNKLEKLIDSVLVFPKMLELRPIVLDNSNVALGGNMRYRAISEIADMTPEDAVERVTRLARGGHRTEAEVQRLVDYWREWKKAPTATIARASDLSEEEQREFVIKDNVGFGEWDFDMLAHEWDIEDLQSWGMDLWTEDGSETTESKESTKEVKETEKLSSLDFTGMYYEPRNIPSLTLPDCVDMSKYEAKLSVIEESNLTEEQKDAMRILAYRFIKINFEAVANYYQFNATDEEKSVLERLRTVLVDGSVDGFIEDDLIRIREDMMGADDGWRTDKVSGYNYGRGE